MRIHLISIGGAVMHNLALALKQNGHQVSGSDDEIYEPAAGRLKAAGLYPDQSGWNPENIHSDLDLVILGMHARKDNPELLRALELGLKIQSFPEYFAECSGNKTRIVVGGSHGKTSTTAMIMHVLKDQGLDFDYLVGAQLEGFDTMVRISNALIVVIEGDEYLSSAIDLKSKFLWYKPHLAIITGIAWDHVNVFPTFDSYLNTFKAFAGSIVSGGKLFMFEEDPHQKAIGESCTGQFISYGSIASETKGEQVILKLGKNDTPLQVFGAHNLQNMQAAWLICKELGISENDFAQSIFGFKGAAKRLECILKSEDLLVFRDFAHAPSKVKATVKAVRTQFPERKMIAVFELHTYSSLRADFLPGYFGSLDGADVALVYYDPHVFEMKRMPLVDPEEVQRNFGENVRIIHDPQTLRNQIEASINGKSVILLMSSGTFGGMSLVFP